MGIAWTQLTTGRSTDEIRWTGSRSSSAESRRTPCCLASGDAEVMTDQATAETEALVAAHIHARRELWA